MGKFWPFAGIAVAVAFGVALAPAISWALQNAFGLLVVLGYSAWASHGEAISVVLLSVFGLWVVAMIWARVMSEVRSLHSRRDEIP